MGSVFRGRRVWSARFIPGLTWGTEQPVALQRVLFCASSFCFFYLGYFIGVGYGVQAVFYGTRVGACIRSLLGLPAMSGAVVKGGLVGVGVIGVTRSVNWASPCNSATASFSILARLRLSLRGVAIPMAALVVAARPSRCSSLHWRDP